MGANGVAPGQPQAREPFLHRARQPLPRAQVQGRSPRTLPSTAGGAAIPAQAQRHQPKEQQHPATPVLLGLRLAATGTRERLLLNLGNALGRQLLGRLAGQGMSERMDRHFELLQGAGKDDLLPNHSGEQSGGLRQQGVLHAAPPFARDTAVLAALPIFPPSYHPGVLRS